MDDDSKVFLQLLFLGCGAYVSYLFFTNRARIIAKYAGKQPERPLQYQNFVSTESIKTPSVTSHTIEQKAVKPKPVEPVAVRQKITQAPPSSEQPVTAEPFSDKAKDFLRENYWKMILLILAMLLSWKANLIKETIYPTISFHVEDLQKMASMNTNELMELGKNDKDSRTFYDNVIKDGKIEYTRFTLKFRKELITQTSNEPNRFAYYFKYINGYNKLMKEIALGAIELADGQKDTGFIKFPQYQKGNCIFIGCDFDREYNKYKIIVLRADRVISSKPVATQQVASPAQSTPAPAVIASSEKLTKLWHGNYGGNKISLAILKVVGDSVWGYSSVHGNFTSFSGNVSASNAAGIRLSLRERQSNANGKFEIGFDSVANKLIGTWKSYDGDITNSFELTTAKPDDEVKVVSDETFIFTEPNINSKTKTTINQGGVLYYDSLNSIFVHCHYNFNGSNGSCWLLAKKISFE